MIDIDHVQNLGEQGDGGGGVMSVPDAVKAVQREGGVKVPETTARRAAAKDKDDPYPGRVGRPAAFPKESEDQISVRRLDKNRKTRQASEGWTSMRRLDKHPIKLTWQASDHPKTRQVSSAQILKKSKVD